MRVKNNKNTIVTKNGFILIYLVSCKRPEVFYYVSYNKQE